VKQIIQNANQAWINPKTLSVDVTVVLYNGELGIYTVVKLNFDFSDRGGEVKAKYNVLTAEVLIRTNTWIVLEALIALFCASIVFAEAGELWDSIRHCHLFNAEQGYFRDPGNVIDWSVVLLYGWQAYMWYDLEVNAYPDAFEMLMSDHGTGSIAGDQNAFIEFIAQMSNNADSSKMILRIGAVNLIILLMRVIKQCSQHPRLAFITSTAAEAGTDLAPFGVLFGMFYFAFSFAALLVIRAPRNCLWGAKKYSYMNMKSLYKHISWDQITIPESCTQVCRRVYIRPQNDGIRDYTSFNSHHF
jgi:hypothetical protein